MPNRRKKRGKKKRVREMRTREGEILAVAWHRATLIHCIAQSCWVIIHTGLDNFTFSTHMPFPIFLVCPAVSYTATPGTPFVLRLALPSEIKEEEASVQSLVGVPATLHATHIVNTYRGCTACHRQGIRYREYKKAEVREAYPNVSLQVTYFLEKK